MKRRVTGSTTKAKKKGILISSRLVHPILSKPFASRRTPCYARRNCLGLLFRLWLNNRTSRALGLDLGKKIEELVPVEHDGFGTIFLEVMG